MEVVLVVTRAKSDTAVMYLEKRIHVCSSKTPCDVSHFIYMYNFSDSYSMSDRAGLLQMKLKINVENK